MIRRPPRSTLFPYTNALPISANCSRSGSNTSSSGGRNCAPGARSEEHTSELQSRENLVCRLLLEKKKKQQTVVPRHVLEEDTNFDGIFRLAAFVRLILDTAAT